MKLLYFLLRCLLQLGLRFYFRSFSTSNGPKKINDKTIYVSNHPSAFMDPLVIGTLNKPSVYFMTMASVFKGKFLMNLLMNFQMLPIFRAVDGKKALANNNWVFKKCIKLLSKNKNLLIFGESITDEQFIRRVKPLKKGPFRIGFDSMVALDWRDDIKIQVIGLNYSSPNYFRSDIFMNYGEVFLLKDYKEQYLAHPEKALNTLRKEVQLALQNKVVHIERLEYYDLFEKLLMISFKGLNVESYNSQLSLEERYSFSKKFADKFNDFVYKDNGLDKLSYLTNSYYDLLKENSVKDIDVYESINNYDNKLWVLILELIISLPLFLVGFILNFIPYFITKRLVENIFKRPVFWNAVKVLIGGLFIFLFQLPILIFLHQYFLDNLILTFIVGLLFPVTGVFSYQFVRFYKRLCSKYNFQKSANKDNIIKLRQELSIIVDVINK